jgi:hypothetical protein
MLAVQIGRLHSGLVLLQDRDDLLFGMPLALDRLVPSLRTRLQFVLYQFKEAMSCATYASNAYTCCSRQRRTSRRGDLICEASPLLNQR